MTIGKANTHKWIISELAISEIQPAPYNPRKDLKPGDAEYEKLRRVMARYDLVEPLVWNKRTRHLVGGHQRLKILKARGDVTVPAVIVDLDEADEKALNLALNKVSGDWDLPKLGELLLDLNSFDFDMSLTGFDPDEITSLLSSTGTAGQTDEDETPDPPAEPVSEPGDLWVLGRHRVHVGDSTSKDAVQQLMGPDRADLFFSVPLSESHMPVGAAKPASEPSATTISTANRFDHFFEKHCPVR